MMAEVLKLKDTSMLSLEITVCIIINWASSQAKMGLWSIHRKAKIRLPRYAV